MSFSGVRLRRGLQVASVGSVAAVAVGFLSVGAASADTFVPLPDGSVTRTLVDGTVVTVTRTGESATVSPSMGATPLHRNVWVSGSARVELSGPNAEGGDIEPGYVVGCQLALGGEAGAESGIESDWAGEAPGQSGAGTAGVSIGPGQAESFSVLDLESADDFGGESHSGSNSFSGTSGSVTWADSTMAVNGCAGYAQARSFVNVTVETSSVSSTVTLWGQPFSIG